MFDYSITAYIAEDLKIDNDSLWDSFGSPLSSTDDEPRYRFENPFGSPFSSSPDPSDDDQSSAPEDTSPQAISALSPAHLLQRKKDWESFMDRMTPEKRALVEQQNPVSRRRFSAVKTLSTHSRTYIRPPTPNSSSDEDADGDSDDEYIPSPVLSSNKRLRSESVEVKSEFSSIAIPSPITFRPTKRVRVSPPARNKPSPPSLVPVIQKALKDGEACDDLRNICPVCRYEQENRRMPDFRRHMETHLPKGRFWCSGVPVEVAHQYQIPDGAKPFWFQGEERIGGCGKSFSRRDARKRHLDNLNIGCVTDH